MDLKQEIQDGMNWKTPPLLVLRAENAAGLHQQLLGRHKIRGNGLTDVGEAAAHRHTLNTNIGAEVKIIEGRKQVDYKIRCCWC